MAYDKHTWECGEKITADKLNHIENGVELASQSSVVEPLYIDDDYDKRTEISIPLDTTFGEIKQALLDGRPIYWRRPLEGNATGFLLIDSIFCNGNPQLTSGGSILVNENWYNADSDDDYPIRFY